MNLLFIGVNPETKWQTELLDLFALQAQKSLFYPRFCSGEIKGKSSIEEHEEAKRNADALFYTFTPRNFHQVGPYLFADMMESVILNQKPIIVSFLFKDNGKHRDLSDYKHIDALTSLLEKYQIKPCTTVQQLFDTILYIEKEEIEKRIW